MKVNLMVLRRRALAAIRVLAVAGCVLLLPATAGAAPAPSIVPIESAFSVWGVNDSGWIIGGSSAYPNGAIWKPSVGGTGPGTFTALSAATLGALTDGASAPSGGIGNNGTVGGQTSFTDGKWNPSRPTLWHGGGTGAAVPILNAPDDRGGGRINAVSPNGSHFGGFATRCDGATNPYPYYNGCSGTYATADGAFAADTTNNSSVYAINNSGQAVGTWDGGLLSNSHGVLFTGGTPTLIGLNPRAILTDGTIVGDAGGSGGIRVRRPSGTVDNTIACGYYVYDANDAGDILAYTADTDGLRIWHEGVCYRVSDVLPDGNTGWKFPSIGSCCGRPSLNELGQIAAVANKTGYGPETAVLLTPQYPSTLTITATPAEQPGEYDFTVTSTGTASSVQITSATWDFGDGTTSTQRAPRKRYTKPGTFTAKVTVTRADTTTESKTTTITIGAPRLGVGITLPGHDTGTITVGTTFDVVIGATATADGVGDLRDLAYQGGIFTSDTAGIIDYTTAAIPPFTIAPGDGNVQTIHVRAAAPGTVKLSTLLIGKDAIDRTISATHNRTVTIVEADGSGASSDLFTDDATLSATPTPTPTPTASEPTPTPTPSSPAPPSAPAAAKIAFAGTQPTFAGLGTAGRAKLKLPVREPGVTVAVQLEANATQSRKLALHPARKQQSVVLGGGTVTTGAAGTAAVTIKLTAAAKQAFARLGRRTSTTKTVDVTLRVTLSRAGASSVVTKTIRLRK
ncbi:MAG: PKD domain-containing protein [Patulibacter sp.]